MDLRLLERAAWEAAGAPLPSEVARAVTALRARYLADDEGFTETRVPPATATLAKLAFFGVADAPKLGFVLGELAAADALPKGERWRVLDVGAGPGTTTLALAEWMRATARGATLDVVGLDLDAASLRTAPRLFDAWRRESGAPSPSWRALAGDALAGALPDAPFDLVVCVNALNEIARGAPEPLDLALRLVEKLVQRVTKDGSVVFVEPALREPSRALHRLRDALIAAGAPTVFAPCLRAAAPCPMLASARDWCHEEREVELPERLRLVARLSGLRRHTLKYSYLVLRRDGRRLADAFPEATVRVVSERLVSKGRDEAFVCGDAGRLRVLRNRRDRDESNAAFDDVDRGRLLRIDGLDPERPRVAPGARVRAWDPASGRAEEVLA